MNIYNDGDYPIAFHQGANERMRINSGGNVGIGTTNPGSNKLYVAGSSYTAGYSYATNSNCSSSDIRLKKDIAPLTNATSLIENLQGVRFNWKAEEYKDKNFDTSPQIGLIAQDVEKVVPEVVKTDSEGFKAVSYEKLTAVLIEAMKEQQARIKTLEAEVQRLKVR